LPRIVIRITPCDSKNQCIMDALSPNFDYSNAQSNLLTKIQKP
jgi:hypothetical protein